MRQESLSFFFVHTIYMLLDLMALEPWTAGPKFVTAKHSGTKLGKNNVLGG